MDDITKIECKRILFKMWYRVEIKQFDSRSFVGDTALDLKEILFKEEDFWKEYDLWKTKKCYYD